MHISDLINGDIRSFILTGFMTLTGKYELSGKEYNELPQTIECNGISYNLKKIEMNSLSVKCSWGFDATYS